MEKTYRIEGMTCDHCVRAVTKALEALDGVERAVVTLPIRRWSPSILRR